MNGGRVVLRFADDVPVLTLVGEFDLSNADDIRNAIATVANGRGGRIVFDLSETTFLDSTILGVLARAARDHDVWIRGANGTPRTALEMSGLPGYVHDADADTEARSASD